MGQRKRTLARTDRQSDDRVQEPHVASPFDCAVLFQAGLASILMGMFKTKASFLGYKQVKSHLCFPASLLINQFSGPLSLKTVSYGKHNFDYNMILPLRALIRKTGNAQEQEEFSEVNSRRFCSKCK